MKRIIALCLLIMLMVAAAVPVAAFGANPGRGFTDADNDGYCDYAADAGCAYADEDGDGVCDNRSDEMRCYARCGRAARKGNCPGMNGR